LQTGTGLAFHRRSARTMKRVLVVEDDSDVRFLVSATLQEHGFQVDEAENGLVALEAVGRARPNVILLDMRMPIMNGWTFVSELRKRWGRTPPLVVMTAATDARERAREVAADAWLAKPFELDALVDTVDGVLAAGGVELSSR
jgi:DNA-binding response OmpR family regulator